MSCVNAIGFKFNYDPDSGQSTELHKSQDAIKGF